MHDERVDDATNAWIEAIALLTAAADRAVPGAGADELSLALGAGLVACDAVALLPDDADELIEAFVLPAQTADWSIRDLIADADSTVSRLKARALPGDVDAVLLDPGDADAAVLDDEAGGLPRIGARERAHLVVPDVHAGAAALRPADSRPGGLVAVLSGLRALRSEAGA